MQERDDMQVFTYKQNGYTFCFRLLNTNIKTYDEGKYFHFMVNVKEQNNKMKEFVVSFRLPADEIDTAYYKTIEYIQKKIEQI